MVGIGVTMSLAAAGMISDMTKQNAQVRANLDYVAFVNDVKMQLLKSTGCQSVLGPLTYVNTADTVVPGLNLNGVNIPIGGTIPGTQLTLQNVTLLQTPDAPVLTQMTDGGVVTNFRRHVTRLRLVASRPNSAQIRPANLTLTLFNNATTNALRFCSSNDSTAACVQMGGVFIPGSGAIEDRCDILPAFGGCAKGGTYSTTNGSCSAANPYTGGCSCGVGFTPFTIGQFTPSKSSTYTQYECLRCSPNVNPSNNPSSLLPLYDEDAIENELLCAQNITVCQACQNDPTSQTCICGRNPGDPACTQPSACTTYGTGTCPCLAEQMTAACSPNYDYATEPCASAYGAYFGSCVQFYGY